jgi:hypothetical protein
MRNLLLKRGTVRKSFPCRIANGTARSAIPTEWRRTLDPMLLSVSIEMQRFATTIIICKSPMKGLEDYYGLCMSRYSIITKLESVVCDEIIVENVSAVPPVSAVSASCPEG